MNQIRRLRLLLSITRVPTLESRGSAGSLTSIYRPAVECVLSNESESPLRSVVDGNINKELL